MAMTESWKLTLPCSRTDAEMLAADMPQLAVLDPPPVLMTSEMEEFSDNWKLEAYFEGQPDDASIDLLLAMTGRASRSDVHLEKLADEDWVTISQQGLEPFCVGRFFVHSQHGETSPDAALTPLYIEASRAFGTGHHETTAGCLAVLDDLRQNGRRFRNIADIGTGTGLLSFAAMKLWPAARCIASDIDPVAVDVAQHLAHANCIRQGRSRGQLALVVASGTDHMSLQRRAPYDLLIANILAGPLIELAPAFAAIMADGATLILAGLLDKQADDVSRAYARQGLMVAQRRDNGDWPALRLIKRKHYGHRRRARANRRTSQRDGDTGEW